MLNYSIILDFLELTPKKDFFFFFIIGDWSAKVGSQEIPGGRVKFGFGVQNKAGQNLTKFCLENALVIANTVIATSSNNTRDNSTHGHYQMVNIKIRLIIFFVTKDGEVLYSQLKQDKELTVAQIMTPYAKIQT